MASVQDPGWEHPDLTAVICDPEALASFAAASPLISVNDEGSVLVLVRPTAVGLNVAPFAGRPFRQAPVSNAWARSVTTSSGSPCAVNAPVKNFRAAAMSRFGET